MVSGWSQLVQGHEAWFQVGHNLCRDTKHGFRWVTTCVGTRNVVSGWSEQCKDIIMLSGWSQLVEGHKAWFQVGHNLWRDTKRGFRLVTTYVGTRSVVSGWSQLVQGHEVWFQVGHNLCRDTKRGFRLVRTVCKDIIMISGWSQLVQGHEAWFQVGQNSV